MSTNSICQGQQVPILWPLLLKTGHEIAFAHTSFKWANLASNNAGVTVVIIGIGRSPAGSKKYIFSTDGGQTLVKLANNINAYLVDAPDYYVEKSPSQISGLPEMLSGDKLTDGGHLVFSAAEKFELTKEYPAAEQYMGRLVGGQELIKGILRYALVIPDNEAAKRMMSLKLRLG